MTLAAPAAPAPSPQSAAPAARLCLDCGATLSGRFCAVCGQKDEPPRRSLKDLALEFFQHPLIDTKLWKSLAVLLMRPGALTLEYLSGRRTRYVRPLKLYLTISVLFFALFALRMPASEAYKIQVDVPPGAAATPQKQDRPHLPIHWLDERLARNWPALEDPEAVAARAAVSERMAGRVPKAVFILLPLSAVLLKLFWPKRYFVEHLVFTLHLHTWAFASGLLLLVRWPPLAAGYFVWSSVYSTLAFKRVYGGSWWVAMAKMLGVSLAYSMLLGVAMAVAFLWAFLAG